jgi:hypothetical protein
MLVTAAPPEVGAAAEIQQGGRQGLERICIQPPPAWLSLNPQEAFCAR